jgi:hypothetical protein
VTKIAVVEQGVHSPGTEVIFWEPLRGQGLVAREHSVFDGFEPPAPQTTEEAIKDESAHSQDDVTQVYSITFVGRALIWCKHEKEDLAGKSPVQKWLEGYDGYWKNMSEEMYRSAFEGTFVSSLSRGGKSLTFDMIRQARDNCARKGRAPIRDYGSAYSYQESPAYFREVQHTTRAGDLRINIETMSPDVRSEAGERIREQMQRLISSAFMVPGCVTYYDDWRYTQTCHPSRLRGLGLFYSRMTPMQLENLQVGGHESDCVIVDEA